MKSLIIFSDIHEFGPQEMKVNWEFGPNCVYLGDNVDLRCCKKSSINEAKERLEYFKGQFGDRFVYGNHELVDIKEKNFLKVSNILFTHGDFLFWSVKRAQKYRAQVPGMNFLQRLYIKVVFGWIGGLISLPIPQYFKNKAHELAINSGTNTIICGHWHPKNIVNFIYKDINIIVVPRGKTVLYYPVKEE